MRRPLLPEQAQEEESAYDDRHHTVALRIGLLPQGAVTPEGIRVADLVSRGRHPHHGPLRQWSRSDEEAVVEAMAATGVTELADRAARWSRSCTT